MLSACSGKPLQKHALQTFARNINNEKCIITHAGLTGKLLRTAAIGLLSAGLIGNAAIAEDLPPPAKFNADNRLELPLDYREWIQVGSNVSPNELNNGKAPFNEMRTIYMDRGAFKHWKETGEFRTGTLILKEVMSITRYQGMTGTGYGAGEVVAVAGMLKDPVKFANEPGQWGFYRFPKLENSEFFQKPVNSSQPENAPAATPPARRMTWYSPSITRY
ncbi:cytochrome P460 family protein [Aliamphritea spongicola]|nr:cytochrome P460 family protein [Aliamphritea spongicola]